MSERLTAARRTLLVASHQDNPDRLRDAIVAYRAITAPNPLHDPRRQIRNAFDHQLLTLVESHPNASTVELAQALGLTPEHEHRHKTVMRGLSRLERKGFVQSRVERDFTHRPSQRGHARHWLIRHPALPSCT